MTQIREVLLYQALALLLALLMRSHRPLSHDIGIWLLYTNCIAFSIRTPFYYAITRWGFIEWSRTRQLAFAIPCVVLGTAFGRLVAGAVRSLASGEGLVLEGAYYVRSLGVSVAIASLVTLVVVGFYHLRGMLESRTLEAERLRRLQARTQVAMLKSKLNPHFLFNTLDTMLGLVETEPKKVETMILTLSDIYRKMLRFPETDRVPLASEFELAEQYLSLEKIRLGERLRYRLALDERLKGEMVPPLLLQPLVENAVIHGISKKPGGGFVEVRGASPTGWSPSRSRTTARGPDRTGARGSGFSV